MLDKNKTLCRDWLCGQFPDQQRDILPVLCTTMPHKYLLLKLQCNTSIFYLNYSTTQALHQYKERGNVLCSSTIIYVLHPSHSLWATDSTHFVPISATHASSVEEVYLQLLSLYNGAVFFYLIRCRI